MAQPNHIPPINHKALRTALRSLYDLERLGSNPLASLGVVNARAFEKGYDSSAFGMGKSLRDILVDSIDHLKPENIKPDPAKTPLDKSWRSYWILYRHYIREASGIVIAGELGISPDQYNKDIAKALKRLADIIRDQEQAFQYSANTSSNNEQLHPKGKDNVDTGSTRPSSNPFQNATALTASTLIGFLGFAVGTVALLLVMFSFIAVKPSPSGNPMTPLARTFVPVVIATSEPMTPSSANASPAPTNTDLYSIESEITDTPVDEGFIVPLSLSSDTVTPLVKATSSVTPHEPTNTIIPKTLTESHTPTSTTSPTPSATPSATSTNTPTITARPENFGQLRICKVAGAGALVGMPFTIYVNDVSYIVPAGGSDDGYCVMVGQFTLKTQVTIQEVISASYFVARIEVKRGSRVISKDVSLGMVVVEIGEGLTEVIFTNKVNDMLTSTPKAIYSPTPAVDSTSKPNNHNLHITSHLSCVGWEVNVVIDPNNAEVSYSPGQSGKWNEQKTANVTITAQWPDGFVIIKTVKLQKPKACAN